MHPSFHGGEDTSANAPRICKDAAVRSVLGFVLLLAGCASDDTRPTSTSATSSSCVVPAGADPRVHAAVAIGWKCTRIPIPLRAPRDVVELAGAVYVTEMAAGRVSRLDGDHATSIVDGLTGPIGLRAAPDGSLVVTEEGAQRVSRIVGGTLTPLATGLGNATYVAVGGDGTIYASAFSDINGTNGVIHRIGGADFLTGLAVPEGLAFDASGALIVAEWGGTSHASRIVNSAPLNIATGFVHLYGVAVKGTDTYLADVGGNKVVVVHANGAREDVLTDVAAPAGMSFAANGDLIIAELVAADTHDATGYVIRLSH
jgi:sugar lactone lactonase YvrE